MPTYGPNFRTVCNDLVQFSETTETLAFTKRNALLGYQKSTDTDFIFCPDGSPVDYKKEGIVADGKGDFYVRVEALLPGMIIEIPDVGRVKVLTVQLGKLFTNRMPGHGVNSIQLSDELLNENERDMNVWIVTIDKNLFDDNECCKAIYDYFGTEGSTVDLNGEKLKIQMTKEIFDKMVKDSDLTPTQLVDMFYNEPSVLCKWTENYLNHNESNVAAVTAENHSDRLAWVNMIVSMLNEFTLDQKFKDTAATQTTAGGYSIYGNPLEVFVNNKGYELNYVFKNLMVGAYQVDQVLDHFLGNGQMNGANDIVKKENSNCIFIPGKDVTRMQQAWDSAFGTIWGNLPDAKTMKTGISKLKDDHGDNGLYSYLYDLDCRRRHKGIAQELFDAFTKGRTAINNKDYTTRDICICIIRRLVSRVILQKTLDFLNLSISTITQKGVINNPSPNRMQFLAIAMGLMMACTFTHREYDYLKIYNKEKYPYVESSLLVALKLLKFEGLGEFSKYELDASVWHLLGKDGVDTLKFMRNFVSVALLENDPAVYLDMTTNAWVRDPVLPTDEYIYFTAESLNNTGRKSTFTINLPNYPPADTFISSPNYVETISAFAVPKSVVENAYYPELYTSNVDYVFNGLVVENDFLTKGTLDNIFVTNVDKTGKSYESQAAERIGALGFLPLSQDKVGLSASWGLLKNAKGAAVEALAVAYGYSNWE